jgi:PAS domain S-box-containing protein
MAADAHALPRQIRTISAVRLISFGWCFMVFGLHAWERGFGIAVWIAAGAHFLVYPHLIRLRAARARNPARAELQHLYADALLLGIWISVLEFPTWIAYPLVFAPAINAITSRGLLGLGLSLTLTCAGVLLGVVIHGYHYEPATSQLVTWLCFLGALGYTSGVAWVVYRQAARMVEARNTIRTSEQRYRLIAEHAGDLVAMVDRNGRWLYTSPSYARFFRAEDLAIGADAFRNLHEEDQFRVRGAVQVVVRSGESCRLRMRLHTYSGEVRRIDAMVHAVHDEAGAITGAENRITGAVIASRDVTELRDREEQLEVAAHAFERMTEGMVITNAAGRILTVNQSYSRITGYAPEEVLGKQETEFRAAMQPQSFYDEIYAEVMRSGRWEGSTWCRRRDGNVYREWRSVSAVRDAEERITHFVALFRELNGHGGAQERPMKSA